MKTRLLSTFVVAASLMGCSQREPQKEGAGAKETPPFALPAGAPASPSVWTPDEFLENRKGESGSDIVILDVRSADEFAGGHVPGAINIAHDALAARTSELEAVKGKPLVVYCRSGRRSALALDVLKDAGFSNLIHLKGDMLGWQEAGLPTDKAPPAAGL